MKGTAMKKIVCMLLVLLLLLSGCGAQEPAHYTGTMEGYEFYHTTERNRLWEEDILYLAEQFLQTHPLLANKRIMHSYMAVDPKTNLFDQKYDLTDELYNESVKNEFIAQINELIPRISRLSNAKIAYELQRIIATLNDPHSGMDVGFRDYFPLQFEAFYEGDETVYRVARAPQAHSNLLLAKLKAINGVPVEEIVEKLRDYVAYDNEYWMIREIANPDSPACLLTQRVALQKIGIPCVANFAVFTFETEEGMERAIIPSVSAYLYEEMEMVSHPTLEKLAYNTRDDLYWYELMDGGKTMYIRFDAEEENPEWTLNDFRAEVQKIIRESERPLQIVFDFRNNSGGYLLLDEFNGLTKTINRASTNGVYILIDSGSFSAGVLFPHQLRKGIEGAVLVGTPAGQFANTFGGSIEYTMPNTGYPFYVSSMYIWGEKDVTQDALYPDVLIHQSLEDYLNGVDAALQYVLDQE